MLTAGELAKILKIDRNTIIGWISRHSLKASKKVTNSKKKYTFIKIEDFWDWCYEHLEKVDLSQYEAKSLLPEPSWVAREMKESKKVSNYKKWTTKEEIKLKYLVGMGYSWQKIGEILERKPGAVEKKYSRIKEQEISFRE
ncbi:helix-turn-helix domain-containing protein [Neobacillus terrae]|uniref:helix-turn-helix domain-containing protein n=1 Tax=Neobacillus terrae TaxID=3034837 RepID=UPI001FB158B1|nr:helix-turn-helix domain-containing protein [Neobacillus terrae]